MKRLYHRLRLPYQRQRLHPVSDCPLGHVAVPPCSAMCRTRRKELQMKRDHGVRPRPSERRHSARARREMLRLKRAYEPAVHADGYRILIDRLWPRGLSKEKAAVNEWMKEVAPSADLRRWFGHDPERWRAFRRRYERELRAREELVREIAALASRRRVTLVYGARDEAHNDAVVLAAVVRAHMKRVDSAASRTRGNTRGR